MNYRKNLTRSIKTIYVEEAAHDYDITRYVLENNKDADVISIKNYKDLFNRNKQYFSIQKLSPSLILAVKKDSFIYKGANALCQSIGHKSYYYTTLMLNCIYDCEYCFLQGMYNSANIVAFVNIDDFKNEFNKLNDAFIALSYETDLIAYHGVIPYLDYFYDYFKNNRGIITEVRTKSANVTFFKKYKPLENMIFAFTLTPEEIINKYERYTPSLKARIKAVNTAIEEGYNVRICFDPVFADENDVYEEFYKYVFKKIDSSKVLDIGYGFFRMPKEYFNRISKTSNSVVYVKDFANENDIVTYSNELMEATINNHLSILENYIEKEKIY